jgi:hypothetical protein
MIKPPILCIEGNDVVVFATQEDAENWIEPMIVSDGDAGETYDSAGHLLRMEVGFKEQDRSFFGFKWKRQYESTILREGDSASDYTDELKKKLTAYLANRGVQSSELRNASLSELALKVGAFMPRKKKFKTA